MYNYKYIVESRIYADANYLIQLLKAHGLLYCWVPKANTTLDEGVLRILIYKSISNNQQTKDFKQIVQHEIIISINEKCYEKLGLIVSANMQRNYSIGYLVPIQSDIQNQVISIPVPLGMISGCICTGDEWKVLCNIIDENAIKVFCGTRAIKSKTQTFFCFNLIKYFENNMLGPITDDNVKYTEWSEVYGNPQSLAINAYSDRLIQLLIKYMVSVASDVFPLMVDYYPPSKSAPIIITGDSDDATDSQLLEYVNTIQHKNAVASLIMRQHVTYNSDKLTNYKSDGHNFGIHPYSDMHTYEEYAGNFYDLYEKHTSHINSPVYAVRNHRFQWVGRTSTIEIERKLDVIFDLNCVAVNDSCWMGTGSGVGFPIPFPPQNDIFSFFPLQLPTIIEDDVFLFNHDYCFKDYVSGDRTAVLSSIDFIYDWVISKRMPATLNLHPEHVTNNSRMLLDEVLNIIEKHDIWTPSLEEFSNWLQGRNNIEFDINYSDSDMLITINTTMPTMLIINYYDVNDNCNSTYKHMVKSGVSKLTMTHSGKMKYCNYE